MSLKSTVRKTILSVPALRGIAAHAAIRDIQPSREALKNEHVANLERQGFSEVGGFLSESECDEAIEFLKRLEYKNPNAGYPYDRRFWLTHEIKMPAPLTKFMDSPDLKKIAADYMSTPISNDVMLANIVRFNGENLGSGNGWHRDGTRRGIKAILYLVDVTDRNGALTVVKQSFRKKDILDDSNRYGLNPFDVTLRDPAYNKRIDGLLDREPARRHSFTGKRGTVFLFETRALHRGLPITEGERYALTNYYEDAARPQVEKKRAAQGVLLNT